MRTPHVLLVAVTALTLVPAGAHAGGTSSWGTFTPATNTQDDEVGVIRRAGTSSLLVAWVRHTGATDALVVSTISAKGKVTGTRTVSAGWTRMGDPDIVRAPGGGVRIFFTGSRGGSDGLHSAFSPSAGATFTEEPTQVTFGDGVEHADIGAGSAMDGTPLQSWGGSLGLRVHAGLTATQNFEFQSLVVNTCCGNGPDVVTDGEKGTSFVGWHSDTGAKKGVYVTQLNPLTGEPAGTPALMPGTAGVDRQASRTPITARPSASGIFVAYPTGKDTFPDEVRIWGLGFPSAVLGRTKEGESLGPVGIAVDPKNRLWVFWQASSLTQTAIYARRSDAGTKENGVNILRFGKTKKITMPKGYRTADQLVGDAQSGRLDLVGLFRKGKPGAFWHRQVAG